MASCLPEIRLRSLSARARARARGMLPGLIKCNANEDPGRIQAVLYLCGLYETRRHPPRPRIPAELHVRLMAGHFPRKRNFSVATKVHRSAVAQSLVGGLLLITLPDITDNSP